MVSRQIADGVSNATRRLYAATSATDIPLELIMGILSFAITAKKQYLRNHLSPKPSKTERSFS